MGNTFTIYSGNNHFDIVTSSALYAFALIGLTSQITYTVNGNWTSSTEGTSDGKYNYIFRYKPGNVRTTLTFSSPGSWVFTLNTGTIPSETVVHWVNGTTASYDGNENSSTPFSAVMYNIDHTEQSGGMSGGDVHIAPLYNPLNKIYILPTDNKVYKYFDNMDKDQRIVVNTKTWVLDNKFIFITENLQRINSQYFDEAKNNVTKYILNDNFSHIDTSFVKYIAFMVSNCDGLEKITFDMENLLPVESNTCNMYDIDQYEMKHIDMVDIKLRYITVSDILPFNTIIKQGKKIITSGDAYYREIKIDSNKHGLLTFNLIRLPSRINHRNQIEFQVNERHRINFLNSSGALIRTDLLENVSSLFHINEDVDKIHMSDIKLLDTVEWRKRRSDIIKLDRIRHKKIIRRNGKGELDFYSLAKEFPEKEYLKFFGK